MKYFITLATFFFSAFAVAESGSVSANHLPAGTKFKFLKRIDVPVSTTVVNIAIDEEKSIQCNISLKAAYDTDKFIPENYELTLTLVNVFTDFYTIHHFEDSPISSMQCFSVGTGEWPLSIGAFEELIGETFQVVRPVAEPIE